MKDFGEFINPTGYILRPMGTWEPGAGYLFGLTALVGLRRKRKQYEFTLDPVAPLTFRHPDGCFIQPDRHGLTDLASIPIQLEPVAGARNQYEPSVLVHDSVCREHGLYFSPQLEGPFTFSPVSSPDAHRLLRLCLRAEGAWVTTAGTWWGFVRTFGPRWNTRQANARLDRSETAGRKDCNEK